MPKVKFLELIFDPAIEVDPESLIYEPYLNPPSQPIMEKRSYFDEHANDDFIKTQDLRDTLKNLKNSNKSMGQFKNKFFNSLIFFFN